MVKSGTGKYHPADSFIHADVFPSVWCSGCGIGTAVHAFIEAVQEKKINLKKTCVVSGVGCMGKIAEYLKVMTHSVTDGQVIDYAIQLRKKNRDLTLAVFLNNADFLLTGGRGFIDACKAGADLIVVYINNFICANSKDGFSPITPFMRMSVDGKFELPFNIPLLAKSYGARYIARWTPLHAGWLRYSLIEAMSKNGLSMIEVVSPCLIYEANSGRIQDAVERMKFYDDNSEISNCEPAEDLDLRSQNKIIIGKFLDTDENKR